MKVPRQSERFRPTCVRGTALGFFSPQCRYCPPTPAAAAGWNRSSAVDIREPCPRRCPKIDLSSPNSSLKPCRPLHALVSRVSEEDCFVKRVTRGAADETLETKRC